jgi:hypothetical protein
MSGETKEIQEDPSNRTGGLQAHLNAGPPRYGPKMIPWPAEFSRYKLES